MRLTELMADSGMTTYAVAKAVERLGVSEQAVYRLARANGKPKRIDMRLLAALCEVFNVSPNELLERDRKPARR